MKPEKNSQTSELKLISSKLKVRDLWIGHREILETSFYEKAESSKYDYLSK